MPEHTDNLQDPTSDSQASFRSSVSRTENYAQPRWYRPRLEEYRARLRPTLEVLRLRAVSTVRQAREHVSSGTLRRDAGAFIQRAQQRGQSALRDRLQDLRGLRARTPDADAPREASLSKLEQDAELHRAKLMASIAAFRERTTNTVEDVRHSASPDSLRREAAVYFSQARRAGLTALAERLRRRPWGTAALGAGLGLSVWRLVRAAPASLLLTGAGAAALLQSKTESNREVRKPGAASRSREDYASIAVPSTPRMIRTAPPDTAVPAAEPVSSRLPQSPRAVLVRTRSVPPTSAISAMARVRNDVLVRTALERPALVGAATIALGAVIGSLSSARTSERRGIPARQSRAAGAANRATEVDGGDSPSAADERLNPQGRPETVPVEEQTAAFKEGGPQEVGVQAANDERTGKNEIVTTTNTKKKIIPHNKRQDNDPKT